MIRPAAIAAVVGAALVLAALVAIQLEENDGPAGDVATDGARPEAGARFNVSVEEPARQDDDATGANASAAPEWPVAGSHVSYATASAWEGPRDLMRFSWANATWTFDGEQWIARCEGTNRVSFPEEDLGNVRGGSFSRLTMGNGGADLPPHVVPTGEDRVVAWTWRDCRAAPDRLVDVGEQSVRVANETVLAQLAAEGRLRSDTVVAWDPDTRLALAWRVNEGDARWTGELTSTDAPVFAR